MVGLIAAVDNTASVLAFSALLFAGELTAGYGIGIGLALLGGAVLAITISLRSALPGAVALVQEMGFVVLAATVVPLVAEIAAPDRVKVATIVAILGLSTLFTGVLFWTTGRLRLGRLARFLPYPVIAGFLAGSGWLLVDGSMAVATGHDVSIAFFEHFEDTGFLLQFVPTIAFAAVLLLALHRFPYAATLPCVMMLAIGLFYGVLFASGTSLEEARLMGLLPQATAGAGIRLPDPAMIFDVDWSTVLAAVPAMVSVAALTMIGLLFTVSGLELAFGRDVDLNRELRANGLGNIVSGFLCGPIGFPSLGMSVLADRFGVRHRGPALVMAGILLLALFVAGPVVFLIPIFPIAGYLLFIGIELLQRWLLTTRGELPPIEWLIVVAILTAVAILGFMPGLAVGLFVSVVVFVFNYSRLPVVRLSASGAERRSAVDRSAAATRHLSEHGSAIEVLELQGYLFFGTADRLVDRIRNRLQSPERPLLKYLVLDFRHVSGIDSAATVGFQKIRRQVEARSVTVFLTHVSVDVLKLLRQAGLEFGPESAFVLESDIDHALERAEENLLSASAEDYDAGADLVHHLQATIGPHPRLADLVARMERVETAPGTAIIRAGEAADDVFFVARGRVKVQLTLANGRVLRLRTMTGGAVIGEMAFYSRQGRTADVIVEVPSDIFRLGAAELGRMEAEEPELAVLAHRLLASNLSEKLAAANRMIQIVER